MTAHIRLPFDERVPNPVAFNGEPAPQTRLQVLRNRHAGGSFQYPTDQPSPAGVIGPHLAGTYTRLSLQGANQPPNTLIRGGTGLTKREVRKFRGRIRVILVPNHARGML